VTTLLIGSGAFISASESDIELAKKGQNKEVARPYLEAAAQAGKGRVVLIGSHKRRHRFGDPGRGKDRRRLAIPHMDWAHEMAFINHFYFYLWDAE